MIVMTPPVSFFYNVKNLAQSFVFQTVLGRGSFGKVLLTRITDCEMTVAVKAMKKHTVQQNGDIMATAVEKNMLELAWEHPYLAHLIATVQENFETHIL